MSAPSSKDTSFHALRVFMYKPKSWRDLKGFYLEETVVNVI